MLPRPMARMFRVGIIAALVPLAACTPRPATDPSERYSVTISEMGNGTRITVAKSIWCKDENGSRIAVAYAPSITLPTGSNAGTLLVAGGSTLLLHVERHDGTLAIITEENINRPGIPYVSDRPGLFLIPDMKDGDNIRAIDHVPIGDLASAVAAVSRLENGTPVSVEIGRGNPEKRLLLTGIFSDMPSSMPRSP